MPVAPLLINIFGGSAGRPIKKNKLFYFMNYEGRARRQREQRKSEPFPPPLCGRASSSTPTVPTRSIQLTPAQVQGVIRPVSAPMRLRSRTMQGMPLPNNFAIGDQYNTAGYIFNAPGYNVQNTYIAKIDYHPDSAGKNTLFVRGNLQNDWADNSSANAPEFPGLPPNSVSLANSKGLAAGWTSVISPNLVSTLHYGFTRAGNENSGVLGSNYEWFRGFSTPYGTATSLARIIPVHLIGEDLSWNHGAHNFRFGGSFRNISNQSASTANSFSYASSNPSWISGSGNDLLQRDQRFERIQDRTTNTPWRPCWDWKRRAPRTITIWSTARCCRLDSRPSAISSIAKPRCTRRIPGRPRTVSRLPLGLRLGLEPPVHEINGQQASTNVPLASWLGERAAFAAQGLSQQNAGLIDFIPLNERNAMYPFHKNFAPRLGIAYSPKAESGISKFLFGGPGKTLHPRRRRNVLRPDRPAARPDVQLHHPRVVAELFESGEHLDLRPASALHHILHGSVSARAAATRGRTSVDLSLRGRRIGIVRDHQQHRLATGRALHRELRFDRRPGTAQRLLRAGFLRRASLQALARQSRSGHADRTDRPGLRPNLLPGDDAVDAGHRFQRLHSCYHPPNSVLQ